MAAATEHQHHASPSGSALNAVAFSATLHCLTGCAIGEVLGMIIGTALGFSDLGTIALAVALAFLFGYGLTSLPLLRSGLALGAVIPIALASDTLSIATMEIVDNGIMLAVPGAMEAGVGDVLFWGALSVALVVAGAVAYPVNRWLIERGKGHAVVHETGVHGGPPTRVVAIVAALAAAFGTTVLVLEAAGSDGGSHDGDVEMAGGGGHGGATPPHGGKAAAPDPVRGLAVAAGGLKLSLERAEVPRGGSGNLRFRILQSQGEPVRGYQVEHTKRMHLIVVRRDMAGFQHLHPTLGRDGTWSTPLRLSQAGSYRVFADFKREGRNQTLAADLAVDGPVDWRPLPAPGTSARTADGYEVRMTGARSRPGRESGLHFEVSRGGRQVEVDRYLGARGHLVALREGDLAYLHVHPTVGGPREAGASADHADAARGHDGPVAFATQFPSEGRYRLFLQFRHGGRVHTAAFTREAR